MPGGNAVGAREQVQGPAEDLGGEEGGEDMAQQGGRKVENLGPEIAQHVAQDVRKDDIDGGEFHREAPFQADQDGHEHGQDREEEGVRDAGQRTKGGDHGMQDRESVDDVCRPDLFHRLRECSYFPAIKQIRPAVRPGIRPARPQKTAPEFFPVGKCRK